MNTYRHGGFWRRFLAISIDAAILYLLYFLLTYLELMLFPVSRYARRPDVPASAWASMTLDFMMGQALVLMTMALAYFTFFHGAIGQTPGKMMLYLKVVGENRHIQITYGIAFLRWVGSVISFLFLYLGFLWALFDKRNQTWHDKLAGTLVIRIDQPRPPSSPF